MSLKHNYVNEMISANFDYEIQQIDKQIAARKKKIMEIDRQIQQIDKKLERLKKIEKTIDKLFC